MRLIETEQSFFIKDFFTPGVIAGFTKNSLAGTMPQDLYKALSFSMPYAWMDQVHGPIIHNVYEQGRYVGDGLITDKADFALVVRTADCVPILLADDRGTIAAVHMGWRSAQTGILENLPKDLTAYKAVIGPCMRLCCFEVKDDFYQYKNFTAYIVKRGDKLFFDPIQFALKHLFARGLDKNNLYDTNICTLCSGKDLASFRKDKTERRILNFIYRQGS